MSDKTIRQACRDRRPLDGTDAQALEGALAQAETEIDRLRTLCDQSNTTLTELWGERNEYRMEYHHARKALEEIEKRGCVRLEKYRLTCIKSGHIRSSWCDPCIATDALGEKT